MVEIELRTFDLAERVEGEDCLWQSVRQSSGENLFSTVKLRARGTWASPLSPTKYFTSVTAEVFILYAFHPFGLISITAQL